MKKLVLIAIAFCTLATTAQEKKRNWEDYKKENGLESKEKMSPENRAQLESKKMTLQLDLSSDQQNKVEAALLSHYKEGQIKREAIKEKRKPTAEERVSLRNDMLDAQIALKQKMKTILSAEQYQKYEKMQGRRLGQGKKKMKHKKEDN